MKKYRKLLTTIAVSICLLVQSSPLVLARAGGGGGGGGGGGSSSSSRRYSSLRRGGQLGSPEQIKLFIAIMVAISIPGLLYRVNMKRKAEEGKEFIEELSNEDKDWDYDEIEGRVAEVFYRVQEAWQMQNMDMARDCISNKIYYRHNDSLRFMTLMGKANFIDDIRLLKVEPISVTDCKDDVGDSIWFLIKASMKDYDIDNVQGKIKRNGNTTGIFQEYWKFIRSSDTWILDEILQTNEIKEHAFKNIKL